MSGPQPSGPTDELAGAQATHARCSVVEGSLGRRSSGAAFWFARLYTLITALEIARRSEFTKVGAPFVMHFIPVFFDMYAESVAAFNRGDLGALSHEWALHFSQAAQLPMAPSTEPSREITVRGGTVDLSHLNQTLSWIGGVTVVVMMGISAHIRGDMAGALEMAYRSYVKRHADAPAFADLHEDFFEKNKPIFIAVQTAFLGDLINEGGGMGYVVPIQPEFMGKLQARIRVGLDIDQIYGWRQTAWDIAASRLGAAGKR